MYGKLFEQMYDGTLAANWKGLITFQQLVVLCDEQGIIDMTPQAIAGRTGIPASIIEDGIKFLEAPDPDSRTPDHEGRRIARLDAHRTWGWQIVNHKKYRDMVRREEKKAADRGRIASRRREEKSNENSDVADCRGQSQSVADVAHTNTDIDTGTNVPDDANASPPDPKAVIWKTGVQLITAASDINSDTARTFLGGLVKKHGEILVAEKIAALAIDPKADPRAWLKGALNGADRRDRPTSAVDRVRQATRDR